MTTISIYSEGDENSVLIFTFAFAARKLGFWGYRLGDYAERESPLPIPNREVKPLRADDIEFFEKVGHRQDNVLKNKNPLQAGFLF